MMLIPMMMQTTPTHGVLQLECIDRLPPLLSGATKGGTNNSLSIEGGPEGSFCAHLLATARSVEHKRVASLYDTAAGCWITRSQ